MAQVKAFNRILFDRHPVNIKGWNLLTQTSLLLKAG
jgi:hypothetical protein